MKGLDVLKLAVQYAGEDDLLNTTSLGGNSTPTEQQASKIAKFFACLNDTVQSLALMYFPLKYEETVTSSTGIYDFNSLTKAIIDIVKLVDEHNFNAKYVFFPTHFEAKKGTLKIVYNYLPDYVNSLNASLEVAENYVSLRMLAMGTVSKYFMYCGMYNDADAWNKMFEQACLIVKRRKDNVVMKKRRWI